MKFYQSVLKLCPGNRISDKKPNSIVLCFRRKAGDLPVFYLQKSLTNSGRDSFAIERYQKYTAGEITRKDYRYVRFLSYKYQP